MTDRSYGYVCSRSTGCEWRPRQKGKKMTDRSDIVDKVAEVLRKKFRDSVKRLPNGQDWIDTGPAAMSVDDVAEQIVSVLHLTDFVPRTHIDDLGRRWEWCGGTSDTWAWRITSRESGDD